MTDHPITEPIVGMVLLRVARTVQALQPRSRTLTWGAAAHERLRLGGDNPGWADHAPARRG